MPRSFSLDECLSDLRWISRHFYQAVRWFPQYVFEQIYMKFYLFVSIKKDCRVQMFLNIIIQWNQVDRYSNKEPGSRTAKLALSICLKMKMIECVLKIGNSSIEFLLISCLWLWRHFLTGSCIMTSYIASLSQKYDFVLKSAKLGCYFQTNS